MIWQPSADFRYALRYGDVGTDVAALQLNLGDLTVDGDFGPRTERAVRRFQRHRPRLVTDGIAGPATQAKIAERQMRSAAARVPEGLLKSLGYNESALILGSCGKHADDPGWDIGVFARSSGTAPGSQDFLWAAYDVAASAGWSAENLRASRERLGVPVDSWYRGTLAHGDDERYRWQLAVLAHNYPLGASNIAKYGEATSDDDAPREWIITATGGRLQTTREWCVAYIRRATVFTGWD